MNTTEKTLEAQWCAYDDVNRHIAEDRIIGDRSSLAALAANYHTDESFIADYCNEYQRVLTLWYNPAETDIPEPSSPRPSTVPFSWNGL